VSAFGRLPGDRALRTEVSFLPRGRRILKVAPRPTSLETSIYPPAWLTIRAPGESESRSAATPLV